MSRQVSVCCVCVHHDGDKMNSNSQLRVHITKECKDRRVRVR